MLLWVASARISPVTVARNEFAKMPFATTTKQTTLNKGKTQL